MDCELSMRSRSQAEFGREWNRMMIKLPAMSNCQRLGNRVFCINDRTDIGKCPAAAQHVNTSPSGRICRTIFLLSRIIFSR